MVPGFSGHSFYWPSESLYRQLIVTKEDQVERLNVRWSIDDPLRRAMSHEFVIYLFQSAQSNAPCFYKIICFKKSPGC